MFAYSSVSQGGFILMPLAVAGTGDAGTPALQAVVVYLLVYAATNLGVFAVVIAVARKTRSGAISSYGGLMSYAPGLAALMTIFLASLAGIPPLGGWIGKFTAFRAALDAGNGWGYTIAVIGAVNSAIAFGYYGNLMREMWMKPRTRRRHHADPHAVVAEPGARHHGDRDARPRRPAGPRDPLRRPRQPRRRLRRRLTNDLAGSLRSP